MEDNGKKEKANVFTIGARHRFILCIVFVMVIALAFFGLFTRSYRNAQNRIIALQKQDAVLIANAVDKIALSKGNSSNYEMLNGILDKHYNRQEALLELEGNKLQTDFNTLMFWASCLMIVFLVFSLYSIFKTDEMLGRAEKESNSIHELLMDAKVTCENITNQSQIMMSQIKGKHSMQQPPQPPFAPPTSINKETSGNINNQQGGQKNG